MITVDTTTDDYRFYKTLNEDVLLTPNKYGKYDITFKDDDYVNVTGTDSLYNAIVIAIMTRFNELDNLIYVDFGCKVHELIKARKSEMVYYQVELYIQEVLENMRRIQEINEIRVTDSEDQTYHVYVNVTSINDEIIAVEMDI